MLYFKETNEYYSFNERKIYKTIQLSDFQECIEHLVKYPEVESCYYTVSVSFKPGKNLYVFPHNDSDIISNIRLNNPDVETNFNSAGKSYDQSIFLNCCSMYSPFEVEFENDTDVSLEYDCIILRPEIRKFLMYQKIKVGNSIFYNGMATKV